MKKILYAAVALLAATSCTDENILKPVSGSDDGDVKIIVSLKDSPLSRTIYGQETTVDGKEAFPIYWSDNDTVLLASPQCYIKEATYVIEGTGTASAEAMTKVGATGLQWGEAESADFYSIYPRSFTMNGKLFTNTLKVDATGKTTATLNVRNYQMITFNLDESTGTYVGTNRDDDPNNDDICEYPDAIMYAQKHMSEQGDVYLQYIPFTTAFHVELDGYQWNYTPPSGIAMGDNDEIIIEEITVTAGAGQVIAGVFNAEFKAPDAEGNFEAPEVTVPDQTISNPNVIHIIPTSGSDDGLLTLNHKQKLSFNFFAIPNPAVTSANGWKISVKTSNGTYTRTITNSTDAEDYNADLTIGKIHSMQFPKFSVVSGFTYNVDTWMADIPRNVYTSQISIPGAWYATQSEYQEDTDIHTLWAKGVRAFAVETRTSSTTGTLFPGVGGGIPSYVGISGTGTNSSTQGYYYNAKNITTVMKAIIAEVKQKTYGYAVLAISYALGGSGGHRTQDYQFWLQGLTNAFYELTQEERSYIYQDRVGHATTIGDLAGKLVVYINVSGGLDNGTIEIPEDGITLPSGAPANGNKFPFMYYYVNRKREEGQSPIVQLHTTWDNSYDGVYAIEGINNQENYEEVKAALLALPTDALYINYVNANRTINNGDADTPVLITNPGKALTAGTDNLPTYVGRKQAILRILRNSNIMQDEGRNNFRYFVGAGGTEVVSNSASTSKTNAQAFARVMNPWLLDQIYGELNNKTFSPFGMVFCNFITDNTLSLNGSSYTYPKGSSKAGQSTSTFDNNEIILGIVKMNRMFYLLRDPDQPETLETTPSNSPARSSFNSTHTSAGNAWEVDY